jgi:hypothetical protein
MLISADAVPREDHLGGVVVRPAANGFEVVVFHSSIKQRS